MSETGYKSHIFQLSDFHPYETVKSYILKVFQNLLNARKTPLFITANCRDRLAADVLPEWLREVRPTPDRTPQTFPEGFFCVTTNLASLKILYDP